MGHGLKRSPMGQQGRSAVIGAAIPAIEPMPGTGIDKKLYRSARQRRLDLRYAGQRNVAVIFSIVELDGAGDLVCQGQILINAAAIIAASKVWSVFGGGTKTQPPPQTKAENAHFAGHFGPGAEGGKALAEVIIGLVEFQAILQGHSAGHVIAAIGQLYARVLAPENIWHQHNKTIERVLLGHSADMTVDAKNFLHQHQARPAAGWWQGEIGTELAAIDGSDINPLTGQGVEPRWFKDRLPTPNGGRRFAGVCPPFKRHDAVIKMHRQGGVGKMGRLQRTAGMVSIQMIDQILGQLHKAARLL